MTKVQSAIKQCLKPGADMCLDIRVLYESGKINVLLLMFNISYKNVQAFKLFE